MAKKTKCFFVAICFIALGFVLCRFVLLYQDSLSSKLRIYSYYVSGRELVIQQDGSTAKQIQLQRTPAARQEKITPTDGASVTDKRQDIVTLPPAVTSKPGEKQVITSLVHVLPSKPQTTTTKSKEEVTSTTKIVLTTDKPKEDTTILSGGIPLCSKEGENLGKFYMQKKSV